MVTERSRIYRFRASFCMLLRPPNRDVWGPLLRRKEERTCLDGWNAALELGGPAGTKQKKRQRCRALEKPPDEAVLKSLKDFPVRNCLWNVSHALELFDNFMGSRQALVMSAPPEHKP